MKKLFICSVLVLVGIGCSSVTYSERKDQDGVVVTTFKAKTLFDNNKLSKLTVGRVTGKTSQGLGIGSVENDVNVEAINSASSIVAKVTEAAVAGAIKATVKP